MAKFKIVQTFSNGSTSNIYIPAADEATALSVAQALCDGQLEVFEAPADVVTTVASGTNVSYTRVDAMFKNSTTQEKGYISLHIKATKTLDDVITALTGKIINGINVDSVVILSSRAYTM